MSVFNFGKSLYSVHICICPLCFQFPTSWIILHIFSSFLEPPVPFKNIRFLHSIFTISHSLNRANVSLALLPIFIQNLMAPDSYHSFFRQQHTAACTASSAAWERLTHLVCSSCKRKLEHVHTCLSTRVFA
jgi:hypothetical protein